MLDVDVADQLVDVVLVDARDEAELAQLRDECTANFRAVEVLLDVLTGLLGGRDPVALEEGDLDHLRVALRNLHVDAARGAGVPDLEAIDRACRHPEVLDRDTGGDQPRDYGALDHARSGVRITARDDRFAPIDRRAVGHSEPRRRLGRDIDVDDARDALA